MKLPITLLLVLASLSLLQAQSAGETVTSSQSGAWQDASSWDCNCIPGMAHDVVIVDGHDIHIQGADTVRCESLTIENNASLAISDEARCEITAVLSAPGQITGAGVVAMVGEGDHLCGPAQLAILALEGGTTTLTDSVTITAQLALGTSSLTTAGRLILEGQSGLTTKGGAVNGLLKRRFDLTKTTSFTHHLSPGLNGAIAQGYLDLPGAEYVKAWKETTTAYQSLVGTDTLASSEGLNCALPAGQYEVTMEGQPSLEATLEFTVNSTSAFWKGWHLSANPLTGFVDLSKATTNGPGALGATYHWIDSLQTYAVQVAGLGQFGQTNILTPGAAFWTIADTAFSMEFDQEALVSKAVHGERASAGQFDPLIMSISDGTLAEQSTLAFGAGDDEYAFIEDAMFHNAFRGRNNLDLYSKTADDVSVMVNALSGASGAVVPIYAKALSGTEVTLSFPQVPSQICLQIEDVLTGWTSSIEPGVEYTYTSTSSVDVHRFNVLVGGTLTAQTTEVACASATDGAIMVVGPGAGSAYSLLDAEGQTAGQWLADSLGGQFSDLGAGSYTIIADMDGCNTLVQEVEVGVGGTGAGMFDIAAMPDHIGCYDDHGGVTLDIEGGAGPYTVQWSHGAAGASIEVDAAGVYSAVIQDAGGCSDTTEVEVLAAPQVEALMHVENPVVALIDGEAEVVFENGSNGATEYQWNFGDGAISIEEAPTHVYAAPGAYTVGLNAWNAFCSDTHQTVVTVEVVSSIGASLNAVDPTVSRTVMGWTVEHPEEAFQVDVFDLTGRAVAQLTGAPGVPLLLESDALPAVALIRWQGLSTGGQKTWRLAR